MSRWTFGYPVHLIDRNSSWRKSMLFTTIFLTISIIVFIAYSRLSPDPTPDSILGYSLAIIGSTFMILATIRYTAYKRSRKRIVSKQNANLYWHISFGTIALVILTLHSFGNFNPRSGTFALYGMFALVISGFIGRALDRIMSRLIAIEASKALTLQGDDRFEYLSQNLKSIAEYNNQNVYSFKVPTAAAAPSPKAAQVRRGDSVLQSSWDMAYISLEETPQEVQRDSTSYRFVPDRQSVLSQPGALLPGMQNQMGEIQQIEHSMQREQTYRYIIRFWRIFHVTLMFVTMGLTLWHLEYAAQLLIPVFLNH